MHEMQPQLMSSKANIVFNNHAQNRNSISSGCIALYSEHVHRAEQGMGLVSVSALLHVRSSRGDLFPSSLSLSVQELPHAHWATKQQQPLAPQMLSC